MKIVTKLKLSSIAVFVILCSVCLTLFWHYSVSQKVLQQDHIVGNVLKCAFDLNILTNVFVYDHSERSKQQWYARHDSLLELIGAMGELSTKNTFTLTKIKRNHADMRIIFDILVNHFENSSKQMKVIRRDSELNERFANQLMVKAQMVATNAQQIEHTSQQNRNRIQRKFNLLILCFAVLFASSFCFIAFLIIRSVTNPIKKLGNDAKNIGRGDFHLLSASDAQDEIGDLARSFAQMAKDLSLITVSRDRLTEEIKSREQTEKQVQLLAKFPSENPSPVLRVDKDGGIIYANHGAAALLKEWDCNVGGQLPAEYSNIIVDIFYSEGEETIERLVGDRVFSIHVCPVRGDSYVNLYCHDITDLKKAEKNLVDSQSRYRLLIENLDIGVTLVDKNHNIIMTNSSMGKMFNKSVSELVGKKCYQEFEKQEHICSHCPGTKAMKSGLPQSVQTQGKKDDGSSFTANVRALPVFGEDSQISGFMEVVEDITEREKERVEKEYLGKRLQQSQKMEAIGTLAGGIAHDFNNILGAIIGYTEMARDDSPKESSVAKDLDHVLEASARAVGLVKQILSFSRQDETENVLLQPTSIVQQVISLLRPSLPTTIEITQDINAKTGLIFGDPTQIHQILMNLCTNAFHAMEETGGNLDISLKEIDLRREDINPELPIEAGTFIQLSVGDSGVGMTQQVKDKIFDPYFTTKGVGKGTGMGLSIAHGIIKSYGGFITLSSELNKGTTFNVFLPVVNEEELPAREATQQIPVGIERVLFIDDEDVLADMGKNMLERLGYHVTVRKSSLEALETFQNQPDQFDVVITDQTMPGMTGVDLARRMLQIRPDIPIILCTGYSSIISEEKAKSFGIREFAFKPVQKRDIAMLIRKVLNGNQA
jgi:PAS domain S-box-containing protein